MAIAEIAAQFMTWANTTAAGWGYLGIFLVNLVGSASIIFPVPAFFVTFAMGAVFNPWLVGLAAAIGAALGELTGYLIGFAGKEVAEKKHSKWLKRAHKWAEKRGVFPLILVFAATPLPDDVTGVIAGLIDYDWRKFLLAAFIGKLIMGLALAWGGFFGLSWALQAFGGFGW
ncbi:MAG: VTT domain-containing protein [Candidatus Aenigmatarchaeota archaeon]